MMLSNCGGGEDSWESLGQQGDQTSQSYRISTLNIHWKDWRWSFNTLATWWEEPTHWKDPDAWKDWGQEEKEATEDEMVGSHHWFNGHEFQQTLGDSEKPGSLECCSPWGHKGSDTTQWLNNKASRNVRKCLLFKPLSSVPFSSINWDQVLSPQFWFLEVLPFPLLWGKNMQTRLSTTGGPSGSLLLLAQGVKGAVRLCCRSWLLGLEEQCEGVGVEIFISHFEFSLM